LFSDRRQESKLWDSGKEVSDAARGVLYMPGLQLLAYYRALENGLNPDQPTNLETVVFL